MFKSLSKRLKQKYKSSSKQELNLSVSDCSCPICLDILIEPVKMPCKHEICLNCFETMLDKTNLCCPMCRLRISTWSRIATKNGTLVDKERWKQIQLKFPNEIKQRLEGKTASSIEDSLSTLMPNLYKKTPTNCDGEIRKEYEEYLKQEQERIRIEKENEEKMSLAAIEQVIKDEESLSLQDYLQQISSRTTLNSNTPTRSYNVLRSRQNHETVATVIEVDETEIEENALNETTNNTGNPTTASRANRFVKNPSVTRSRSNRLSKDNARITRSQSLRTTNNGSSITSTRSTNRTRPYNNNLNKNRHNEFLDTINSSNNSSINSVNDELSATYNVNHDSTMDGSMVTRSRARQLHK